VDFSEENDDLPSERSHGKNRCQQAWCFEKEDLTTVPLRMRGALVLQVFQSLLYSPKRGRLSLMATTVSGEIGGVPLTPGGIHLGNNLSSKKMMHFDEYYVEAAREKLQKVLPQQRRRG